MMSTARATVLPQSPHITPNGAPEEVPVCDTPAPEPDHLNLRTLALLEGRTPEEVALDHIARSIPLSFSSSLGEDSEAMAALTRAMFDGPSDLAVRAAYIG
ncbi:hypothetical protein [Streptomyces sp. NPDC050121]|uniref:hypothetical protein n=1 Tax=Streptomyces sp. NPDC050121 TaxID=3365601 RepID=UPI0037A350A7